MAESGVDALSEGLQRVIAPAVRECDAAASSCATAQADLTAHVDRLAHELEVLLAAMPAEAAMETEATPMETEAPTDA